MEPFIGSAAVRRGEFTRRGLVRANRAIYRGVDVPFEVEYSTGAWLRLLAYAIPEIFYRPEGL